jgi:CO dehydrogenase maturation factor
MITIAISGKGGTGKSTIAALIIRWISDHVSKSILAVDADCNVNLNDLLGLTISSTIGAIREEIKDNVNNLPGGMSKQQYLEYKFQANIVETPDFDLIAMGCPEGPGCYCYANNLLRDVITVTAGNYEFIVIDNGAGMEHLSRRTTQNIDFMLIISDPTIRGIRTAGKISRLVRDLETRVQEKYLILNRVKNSVHAAVMECIKSEGLKLAGMVAEDNEIMDMDNSGRPIWESIKNTEAYRCLGEILKKFNFNAGDEIG